MRTIEHTDEAGLGDGLADPPQEIVLELLLARRLERGDPHPLGVDESDRVAKHAALARGVHPLQDEQEPALVTGRPSREQALLQVCETGAHLLQDRLPGRFVAVETGLALGVDLIEVDAAAGHAEQVVEGLVLRHGEHLSVAAPSPERTPFVTHVQPMTVATSNAQPTIVSVVPSRCGSSNQVPGGSRPCPGRGARTGCGGQARRSTSWRRESDVSCATTTPTASEHRSRGRSRLPHRSRSRPRSPPDPASAVRSRDSADAVVLQEAHRATVHLRHPHSGRGGPVDVRGVFRSHRLDVG